MCWADVGLVKRNSNNTIVVSIVVVSLHTLSLKLVRNGAPYYEKVLHIVKFWSICARVLTFENFCLSVALCTPCMSMVRWTSSKTSEALCLRSVTHAYTHTHTRAHTHPTHTHTHTHTNTHTHTHKHTNKHTHAHSHIHTKHTPRIVARGYLSAFAVSVEPERGRERERDEGTTVRRERRARARARARASERPRENGRESERQRKREGQ